ncbi:hypothetical protein J7W19_20430 [Streptomyces mobaraensis NBRC 13819 = DSM 40847]|uniref:Uncharacterized protein n=1 Tax=Streptomyces mobaraensis (strain ATCC 29032 / DSM 40847 / JCM 4168 / NBRC 13819 / NCIMB 11159 / IPCR 16-22) TaxID=1223523 RepID=M3BG27_STRM1|nr:hypothetical protein [Streptomyces mobaraensis]EME98524.1 hypothetical protein H340_21096 [Streptomyces mobaraensis NBRC 13819 = DSM 40847]QTT75424.1 hypothetical protein J7W19_20430 [Streptomyces mobaraensis NBRC 13819 = DSM 40847]
MKRTTLRSAGVIALAAVTIGVAAPAALAATEDTRPAAVAGLDDPTEEDLHAVTLDEAQEAARSLLASDEREAQELVASLDPEELADLRAVADGQAPQEFKANWAKILKLMKKIGGWGKAVAGTYKSFRNWYFGLPWPVRAAFRSLTVGYSLYDIYWHFHNGGYAPDSKVPAGA